MLAIPLGDLIREQLTVIGARAPRKLPHYLNSTANFLDTGRFLRDLGVKVPERSPGRFDVLRAGARALTGPDPLYLEFGVWQGESLALMTEELTVPGARFVGFDSFEGLPEDWTLTAQQGHFDTGGALPDIDDPRVTFEAGWFEDTVPGFALPPHGQLFVNVDSDLYSSAKTVLDAMAGHLSVGDLLYFDEFQDRLNEGRAFREHLEQTGYVYEVLAVTKTLSQILFRRTR